MTRIAIVCDDPSYVTTLRSLGEQLQAQILHVNSTSAAAMTTAVNIMGQAPDTVLLGPELTREQRTLLTEQIGVMYPDVVVVWIVEPDPDLWRLATQSGARDLLAPSATNDVIVSQLQRATAIVGSRRSQASAGERGPETSALGRVVTVVSPKGGSGKTMLSANLAIGLAANAERGVVLVDLDLQFGDVATALGMRPQYSVVDLILAGGDATASKAFLAAHSPGLFLLAAPNNPASADDVEPEQVAKLIAMLRAEFSYVVIDTGGGIYETGLVAIEESTDVMFITTIDVAAIHALRKAVIVLDQLQLDQHRRWFVLNRADSRTGLSPAEIEEVTGLAIDTQVPSHRSISKSMNQGSPAIIDERRNKIGKALAGTVRLIAGDDQRSKAKASS